MRAHKDIDWKLPSGPYTDRLIQCALLMDIRDEIRIIRYIAEQTYHKKGKRSTSQAAARDKKAHS